MPALFHFFYLAKFAQCRHQRKNQSNATQRPQSARTSNISLRIVCTKFHTITMGMPAISDQSRALKLTIRIFPFSSAEFVHIWRPQFQRTRWSPVNLPLRVCVCGRVTRRWVKVDFLHNFYCKNAFDSPGKLRPSKRMIVEIQKKRRNIIARFSRLPGKVLHTKRKAKFEMVDFLRFLTLITDECWTMQSAGKSRTSWKRSQVDGITVRLKAI